MLDINLKKKNKYYIVLLAIFIIISFAFYSFYDSVRDSLVNEIYNDMKSFSDEPHLDLDKFHIYTFNSREDTYDKDKLENIESQIVNEEDMLSILNGHEITGYTFIDDTDYFYYGKNENDNFTFVFRQSPILIHLASSFLIFYAVIMGILIFIILLLFAYMERAYEIPLREISKKLKKVSPEKNSNIYVDGENFEGLIKEINRFKDYSFDTIKKLKQIEQNQRHILNSMSDGVIAIDKDEKIILYNKKSSQLLGAKISGGNYIYNTIRNNELFLMINSYDPKDNFLDREINYLQGEKERILKIKINNLTDSYNEFMGLVIVISDITNIKKLENIRTEFASNVSHELKTPLTSILGFIDTILHGAIDNRETTIRFLKIVESEANRLKRLIEDILLISKLEQREDDEKDLINISDLGLYVLEVMNSRARNKSIDLIENIEKDIVFYGNKDGILQILFNLVSNGIKYTNTGYVRLSIDKQDNNLVISVRDSGIGISEDDMDRIFERFYIVDKSRRGATSTGLGLSIVKHLVILYNGEIKVKSNIDTGTEFIVVLPEEEKNGGTL